MARLFTGGAEFNAGATADLDYDTTSGTTISYDTGTVNTGTYSWKFVTSASGPFLTRQYAATSNTHNSYVQAYFNVSSITTASSISMILIRDATNGNNLDIRLTRTSASTFTLAMTNEQTSTQVGSASSTLNTNTWYRLEFSYVYATGAANAYIDGSNFATGTASASKGSNTIRWGSIDASTMTIFFDDIIVNDEQGTSETGLPGGQKVIRLLPNAAGDVNTFATQTGGTAGAANNFSRVNEVLPNDATSFNGSSTLNQEDLLKCAASGIGSADTVNVVEVWGRYRNSTADTLSAVKFEIEKAPSGTKSQSSSIVPNSITWKMNAGAVPKTPPIVLYKDPDGTNPWTQATLDTLQVGYIDSANPNTASRRVDVTSASVIVSYTPSTAVNATVTQVAANVTASGGTQVITAIEPISSLIDALNTNTYDTTLWTKSGTAANVNLVNNDLEITVPSGTTQFNYYASNKQYDWTSSSAYIHVKTPTTTTIVSQEAGLLFSQDANNRMWVFIGDSLVKAFKFIGGVQTQIGSNLAYNSTSHAYLRISESAGTYSFDTSPDAVTWTSRWTLADPFSGNKLANAWIYSQHWQSEATTTTDKFDGFNTPQAVNASVTQVGANITGSGGTQVVAAVRIANITQVAASVTASGGTQTIATVNIVSIAQAAANVTASGGTQTIATVNIVAISQVAANITAAGGTQVIATVQNASVTQVANAVVASGGTQTIAALISTSVTQLAANITASGGTQVITTVNIVAIAQLAANITASGGTQAVNTVQIQTVAQVAGVVTASGGTQSVSTASIVSASVTQVAGSITATGGTQTVATINNAAVTQVFGAVTASGGTQTIATINNVSIAQLAANVTANGGTQAVATINIVSIAQSGVAVIASGGVQVIAAVNIVSITQIKAVVTASGGTQSIATVNNVAISQVAASVTAAGGTQTVASVNIVSLVQLAANITATGGTQVVAATRLASVAQLAANLTASGGTQTLQAQIDAVIAQRAANITANGSTQIIIALDLAHSTPHETSVITFQRRNVSVTLQSRPVTMSFNRKNIPVVLDNANVSVTMQKENESIEL